MKYDDYKFINVLAYILRDFDDDFACGVDYFDENDDVTWISCSDIICDKQGFSDWDFPYRYLFKFDDFDVNNVTFNYDFEYDETSREHKVVGVKNVLFFVNDDIEFSNIYNTYLVKGIDFLIPLVDKVRKQRELEKEDDNFKADDIYLIHLNDLDKLNSLLVCSKLLA
jgi:hypothetical protein